MAAPAPTRFSILRREIPVEAVSSKLSGVIRSPPFRDPERLAREQPFKTAERAHRTAEVTSLRKLRGAPFDWRIRATGFAGAFLRSAPTMSQLETQLS